MLTKCQLRRHLLGLEDSRMTDYQKSQIATLRGQGYGYKKIGQITGLSVNTIKTYCKRNDLRGNTAQVTRGIEKVCKCCGEPLTQIAGRKPKIFCSDACRAKWWNTHADQMNHRNGHQVVCGYCGQTFAVNKSSTRKYCSHTCYIADRFHGGGMR